MPSENIGKPLVFYVLSGCRKGIFASNGLIYLLILLRMRYFRKYLVVFLRYMIFNHGMPLFYICRNIKSKSQYGTISGER